MASSLATAHRASGLLSAAQTGVEAQRQLLLEIRQRAQAAASTSTSASDRASLEIEVENLVEELDQVATRSTFRGLAPLDGSMGTRELLSTPWTGRVSVAFTSTRASALGGVAEVVGAEVGASALTAGQLEVNGVDVGAASAADDLLSAAGNATSARAVAAAINRANAGVRATAGPTTLRLGSISAGSFAAGDLHLNGVDLGAVTVQAGDADGALREAIDAIASETGITAALDDGELVLTASDGRNIVTSGVDTDGAGVLGVDPGAATYRGSVLLTSSSPIEIGGSAPGAAGLVAGMTELDGGSVADLDLSTASAAEASVRRVDEALGQLADVEAGLAAADGRVEGAIAALASWRDQLVSGLATFTRPDVAAEVSRMLASRFRADLHASLFRQTLRTQGLDLVARTLLA